jgi:hypothetical protein
MPRDAIEDIFAEIIMALPWKDRVREYQRLLQELHYAQSFFNIPPSDFPINPPNDQTGYPRFNS